MSRVIAPAMISPALSSRDIGPVSEVKEVASGAGSDSKLKRQRSLAIWLQRVSMVSLRKLLRSGALSLLGTPLLPALAAVICSLGYASLATASEPRVQFDLPYQIVCVDVTSPEFAERNPGQRMIEARLPFSMLLTSGRAKDVSQVTLRASSPHATMLVADYLPKTLHEEQTIGGVEVHKDHELTTSLGVNLSCKYTGAGVGAETGIGEKRTSGTKYQLLPPRETVVAAGKVGRGAGVYFKLVASDRNPWEGEREIVLILQVPAAWRADYLHVRCEATGVRHGLVKSMDETIRVAHRDFLVALCHVGDEQARLAADELARSESQLRRAVMAAGDPERDSISLLGGAISIPTGGSQPVAPQAWLGEFLFASVGRGKIPNSLPGEVKAAAARFQDARTAIWQLTGWGNSSATRVEVLRPVSATPASNASNATTGWTSRSATP